MIHAQGRRYLVGLRLATLEARLPNPPFLRVHRSHIVNLDHVERMRLLDNGHLEVHEERRDRAGEPRPLAGASPDLALSLGPRSDPGRPDASLACVCCAPDDAVDHAVCGPGVARRAVQSTDRW